MSLYQKYRPQAFSEMCGNIELLESLELLKAQDRKIENLIKGLQLKWQKKSTQWTIYEIKIRTL